MRPRSHRSPLLIHPWFALTFLCFQASLLSCHNCDRPKSLGMTTVFKDYGQSLTYSNSKMYPRFFEIQPTWNDEGQIIGFTYTQLRNNQTYINYYTLWFRLITTAIIPFILMLICNLGIIVYYRKNRYVQNLCSNTLKYTVFSWVKKLRWAL